MINLSLENGKKTKFQKSPQFKLFFTFELKNLFYKIFIDIRPIGVYYTLYSQNKEETNEIIVSTIYEQF